jgi:hypothetical protein
MKLSAYIIRIDSGFAPNPFGHHCTLACCKPTIRRRAEPGDIIIGTASSRYPHGGCLIYAMRVKEVLTYQEYWKDPRFAYRKPSLATPISRRGDNIWHPGPSGEWEVVPGAGHDESARERDTSGENVLIATEFFYFGREAIPVPGKFSSLLARTQGHKNTDDPEVINSFWDWLCREAPRRGRIADPSEFDEVGCRNECLAVEDEDVPEDETCADVLPPTGAPTRPPKVCRSPSGPGR